MNSRLSMPTNNGYFIFAGIDSEVRVKSCTFTGGVGFRGSAIYCDTFSRFLMRDSTLEHCVGAEGSLRVQQASALQVNNTVFRNNSGTAADLWI